MPPLLATQVIRLMEAIDASPFQRSDFLLEATMDGSPVVRWREEPTEIWFHFGGPSARDLEFSPGERKDRERQPAPDFDNDVLPWFRKWLSFVRREISALERLEGADEREPAWALNELPAEYKSVSAEIDKLLEQQRRMRRMAGLLFSTGDSLNRLVRDMLRSLDINAEATPPGATYDVIAPLTGGRLLIEVTGTDGQISKSSKKIAQVLQARTEALENDRVVLALNAFRSEPLAERGSRSAVTGDALKLLVGLDCVIVHTSDLFEMWKCSIADKHAARAVVESIRTASPGLFILSKR